MEQRHAFHSLFLSNVIMRYLFHIPFSMFEIFRCENVYDKPKHTKHHYLTK